MSDLTEHERLVLKALKAIFEEASSEDREHTMLLWELSDALQKHGYLSKTIVYTDTRGGVRYTVEEDVSILDKEEMIITDFGA